MKLLLSALTALSINGGDLPPARYDKPYAGKLIVIRTSNMPRNLYGWTYGNIKGRCRVYIQSYLKGRDYQIVLRHEIGHCNGWGPTHER